MNRNAAVLGSAVLIVMLSACTESTVATNIDAEIKAIKDVEAQWNKDFEAKDAAKLGAHFTDDAVFLNYGAPAVKGKAAIQKALGGMTTDPAFSLKFEADRVEVAKSGDLGYSQGHYTLILTDPSTKKPFTDRGSYVTIFKKQADGWKAVLDGPISEVPPPAPPEPAKKK